MTFEIEKIALEKNSDELKDKKAITQIAEEALERTSVKIAHILD